MLKWLMIIIVALVLIGAVLFVAGSMMPQNHTASRTAHLSQPAESVWATITNVAAFPTWRSDVQSVEQLPSREGRVVWRETSPKRNQMTFEAETSEPPRHLVTRITDKGLPFGGSWDYAIAPDGGGSSITITEHGEIYNPVFRVMSRIIGQTSTIDSYLTALAKKLGDKYTPPS